MIYKDFKGKKLSSLGMGCMRFPTLEKDSEIDFDTTAKMVDYAIKNGINYFDTAWGYHGGKSETVIGEILSNYPRDSFYLADKFPGYDLSNMPKVREIFPKQLEKCKTDYFDFYMFHNVCEANIDAYLNPEYEIFDYLCQMRNEGKIRHLGFSAHANIENIKRFLDAYGHEMEFCQLQINYLDWSFQNAKEKVELVSSYNIPVWVMEPVRGGRLATLNSEMTDMLKSIRADETVPGFAFRFIQSIPEAVVTLSGMSDFDQLKENIKTFEEDKPLTPAECDKLFEIVDIMLSKKTVPCTSCRYCLDHCPQGLDIPRLLKLYNEYSFSGGGFLAPMQTKSLPEDKRPSACVGCKSCEAVCPQTIEISKTLADFAKALKL